MRRIPAHTKLMVFSYRFNCLVRWRCLLLVTCCFFTLQACNARPEAGVRSPGNDAVQGVPVALSILGYNYTNRHIDQFTVNGQGGANVYVSTPTSGGSGTTCCVPYTPGGKEFSVVVRWTTGACKYQERSVISDKVFDSTYRFYKSASVPVASPARGKPTNIEVHFYPDGTVKAALSDELSPPRLKLSDDREDRSPTPRCPNDKKPVE